MNPNTAYISITSLVTGYMAFKLLVSEKPKAFGYGLAMGFVSIGLAVLAGVLGGY